MNAPAKVNNDVLAELLGQPLKLGKGRTSHPLRVEYVRDLTVEELIAGTSVEARIKAIPVGQLRQSHHLLARTLAGGAKNVEAAMICGYSVSRISILKGDPAFQELLEYYVGMEADAHEHATADMHQRLASVGFDSLEILHERLLDAPDSFDNKTLVSVVEAMADRTGYGKTSTVQHDHQLSLTPEAILRVKASIVSGREAAEEDREALLRLASFATSEHPEAEEAEWESSGGDSVREEGRADAEEPLAGSGTALPSVD